MDSIKDFYAKEFEQYSGEKTLLKRRGRTFMTLEIVSFVAAVAFVVLYIVESVSSLVLLAALVSLCTYLIVRHYDVKNDRRIEWLTKKCIVYNRELCYLRGDFSVFDKGDRYVDMSHPYTLDMDVFGRDSLFNRMDRTVTTCGSNALAASLRELPESSKDVEFRRQAVDEMSRMEAWRTDFIVCGMGSVAESNSEKTKINSDDILNVVREVSAIRFPRFFMGKAALVVAFLLMSVFYVMLFCSAFMSLPGFVPFDYGLLLLSLILLVTGRPLYNAYKVVGKLHVQMRNFAGLIRHIHSAHFECKELDNLYSSLFKDDTSALKAFNELSGISDSLDRRGNWLAMIVFNILFLNDFFIVRRFLKWQRTYLDNIGKWIEIIGQFDAYVSKAVFRFNNRKAIFAEVLPDDGVVYRAKGIYHPFLGDKAVPNDFEIINGNYYIITGANMAGKSTFLRAVGVNYVLAMNGLPVFAESLSVSMFNLFSSMRTTDDVSRGISYFNAELLRLGSLIDCCKKARHTLIILDEILKGTNSLDKLNGSRLFLEKISSLPVTGIIATHDLELSKMENKYPERFHNYCFEIQLAENITYTYKITAGVARNQNATYLLGKMLENV